MDELERFEHFTAGELPPSPRWHYRVLAEHDPGLLWRYEPLPPEDAAVCLENIRSLVRIIAQHPPDSWPAFRAWREVLPDWFVQRFPLHNHQSNITWHFEPWLQSIRRRGWRWWSSSLDGQQIDIHLQLLAWPAQVESFEQIVRACGGEPMLHGHPSTRTLSEDGFRANFPSGTSVPAPLLPVLRFQHAHSAAAGLLRLTDVGRRALWYYFRDEALYSKFAAFATAGDGSLFAYWLYAGQDLAHAPIVYLHSEGGLSFPVANTTKEFLSLLSLGVTDWIVYDPESWPIRASEETALADFRKWLLVEFRIDPPLDPRGVIETARQTHPNLNQWIENNRRVG